MKLAEADIETEQKAAIFADGEKIKFNKSGLIYNPNAFAIGDNPYGDDAANQHQYFSMYSNRFEGLFKFTFFLSNHLIPSTEGTNSGGYQEQVPR